MGNLNSNHASITNIWKQTVQLTPNLLSLLKEKVTTELSQVLEEEEKRWSQKLHIEEYQCGLARSIIQVNHTVSMDKNEAVTMFI